MSAIVDRVLAKIDEALDEGLGHIDACQRVLEWVKRESLGDELLAECGVRLLSDLHRNRMGAMPSTWTVPGAAKVNADAVNRGWSIFRQYEAVVEKRLGDCTVEDLKAIAAHRDGLAKANAEAAANYRKVARKVQQAKAKTVHQAFKNDPGELRDLLNGDGDE